jgi:thioredoxin reductase
VRPEAVARVESSDDAAVRVRFTEDPVPLDLDAIFFHIGTEPRCAAATQLGCRLDEDGYIEVDRGRETSVPGVHAAGDITGHPHLISVAAADGVRAALAMHRSLLPESRHI